MQRRFIAAIAFAALVACRSPSNPPSPSATCSSSPSSDALAFAPLRIDSDRRPFARGIFFAPGSSEPLADSLVGLDEISATMKAMPNVSLLAVMGHTETSESAELADQRAVRVIDLLIARGVERARLEARPFTPSAVFVQGGCGTMSPAEREAERKHALAAERSVHFARLRVDDP